MKSSFGDRIRRRVEARVELLEHARAEFNAATIAPLVPTGSVVYDVGSWTGYVGELLVEKSRADVFNFDVVNGNKSSLPFRIFDGRTLPAPNASADVILFLYVLHHSADAAALLCEARRVLRPGGRLLIAEDSIEGPLNWLKTMGLHLWLRVVAKMGWDGTFRRVPQWKKLFRDCGWNTLEVRELGSHMGRPLWPRNILFHLTTVPVTETSAQPPNP